MAYGVLETLASAVSEVAVAPVIPAGRGSIFAAVYAGTAGAPCTILEPSHISVEDFINFLDSLDSAVPLIVGNDISPVASRHKSFRSVSPVLSVCEAMVKISCVAMSVDPAYIRASYLRSPC
jgi:tRNA A37 threonylcarbamoyladenosine modification protein TsaB